MDSSDSFATTTCLMCTDFDVLSTVISVHLKVSTKWTAVTVYPFFFTYTSRLSHHVGTSRILFSDVLRVLRFMCEGGGT